MNKITLENEILPKWLCTVFIDDDGEPFLPCGAFVNEQSTLLCLAHDNVPFVQHHGHVYAPASWLARENPLHAQKFNSFAAGVMRTVRKQQPEAD